MREIMFRVWCKNKNEWEEDPVCLTPDGIILHGLPTQGQRIVKNNTHIIQQFTGFQDKRGVDIYEGDVLNINGGGEIVLVVVSYRDGCFGVIWPEGNFAELKWYIDMSFCETKVVGNIYENPELVSEK